MKIKNVKKELQKTIQKGWRHYLEVKISYKDLGLCRNNFITEEEMFKTLNLVPHEDKSGFVDHYRGYDNSEIHKGIPLTVSFNPKYEYSKESIDREWYKDRFFHEHNGKYYHMEGYAGYINPDHDFDTNPEAEFWLFENEGKGRYEWSLTTDSISQEEKEFLRKFAYNKEFGYDMFGSCNEYFDHETKQWVRTEKYNPLCEDLCALSEYTKTNYYNFTNTHVHITYAIRYSDYVEDFLTDFKRIVKKHRIKNYLCKNAKLED